MAYQIGDYSMTIKLSDLGGGGGGGFIGDIKPLNVDDTGGLFVQDDQSWLRTGVVSSDLSDYPDAKIVTNTAAYTGISFSVASQDLSPTGITWDGTHFWVIGISNATAYKYTAAGVYTGTSFSVASQETSPRGITWDGTSFWVVGIITDTVYKYTSTGAYTGISFSVAGQDTSPIGITWDGTHLWVAGGNRRGFKYTAAGAYTGISFSVLGQMQNPQGITWDGNSLWVVGTNNDAVYEYVTEFVGVATASTEYSVPTYVRIK